MTMTLLELSKSSGLTATKLANKSGVKYNYLIKLLHGQRKLSKLNLEDAANLSAALSCSLDKLVEIAKEEKNAGE